MKAKLLFRGSFAFSLFVISGVSLAEYPHWDTCPKTGNYLPGDRPVDPDPKVQGDEYYASAYGFAQCNCTDYVAYRLNWSGISFSNGYDGDGSVSSWSHAYLWDDAERAGKAKIRVDQYPAVNSVAHWDKNEIGGGYGHVAFVYKINVHGDGRLSSIEVAEFNVEKPLSYGIRTLTPGTSEYPGRFLHFEDKVSGDKPNATCVTNARNLPGGFGPFCWIHGQYSALCEHGTKWYYFDQQNTKFYVLSSSSCPTQPSGGMGSGYATVVGNDSSRFAVSGGSSLEPPGSSPVSGSDSSSDLPNLTMRDVYLLDEYKAKIPSIGVNRKGHCHMNVKNTGTRMAKEKFENRCWISDGNWFDGKGNAIDIGKQDMENLDDGQSRSSDEDFDGIKWPGKYNLVGCTDASYKEKESNEKDNCNMGDKSLVKEFVFMVTSSPDLMTLSAGLTSGKTQLLVNEPFAISSTIYNGGENFGQKYAFIGYFIDGVFIGQNQVLRENLQGGWSKIEELSVPAGIATGGVHEIKVCSDFVAAISEPKSEENNCFSFNVKVSDPNAPVPCPVITADTWGPPWSTVEPPYNAPPFKTDGTLVVTPWCFANAPNRLEIVVQGSTDFLVSSSMRIKNAVISRSYVIYDSGSCSVSRQPGSAWCGGEARLIVEGKDVDTSVPSKPTEILVYTCQLSGVNMNIMTCKWMHQAATMSAKRW